MVSMGASSESISLMLVFMFIEVGRRGEEGGGGLRLEQAIKERSAIREILVN